MPADYDLGEFNQTVESMCHSVASAAGYVQQQKDERGRLQQVAVELQVNLADVNQDAEARKPELKKQASAVLKQQGCKKKEIWTHVNKFVGYFAQCQALNDALAAPQKAKRADDPTQLTEEELEIFLEDIEPEHEGNQ